MKTIISVLALTLISFAGSTMAADAEKGKEIFTNNCTTCHSGGKNAMAASKSLSKEGLETNKMNSAAAIILKALVSHRFTPINTEKTLCYARLALYPNGVAKN